MAIIYLVRHAEADYGWHGPDSGRPLSALGVMQAQATAEHLKECGATEIRTATHARCRQTADAIAKALGLEPVPDPALHISRSFTLPEQRGTSIWVAHSNNIPGAVAALGVPCYQCGHASVWQLEFHPNSELASYRYFEPEI